MISKRSKPLRVSVQTLAMSALLGAASGYAQPVVAATAPLASGDMADSQKRPRSVALLPFKNHMVVAADLFAAEAPQPTDLQLERFEGQVLAELTGQPFLALVPPAEVRRRLADASGVPAQHAAAQSLYRLGLELYLGLASGRAIDKLSAAAKLLRDLFADTYDPKSAADAQFMLGVALVDAGRSALGHVAIKDGFAMQPSRRFRRDFFPPATAAALVAALTDFLSTSDPLRPYGDHQRLAQLSRRLGVDWLVTATLRQGEAGPELWLAVFSAQRRLMEAEIRLPAGGSHDQVNAFVSRWLACVPVMGDAVAGPGTDPGIFADMSLSFLPFLRQPTRTRFLSMGFASGADVALRENLHWFGRLGLHTSLPDAYRDLLRSFNSLRIVTGLGATWRSGPLRLFVNLGVDAHLLGSFVTSADPDCKLFGVDHRMCDKSTVIDLNQNVLVGANVGGGGQLHLGRDFVLALRVSISEYFLPLNGTDYLNQPLGIELGFGYRL